MSHFKIRPEDRGIFKIETYNPSELLCNFSIEESEHVILHCENYSIIVRDIQKDSEGKFRGTVSGLEPPGARLEHIKAGDIVTFTEDQVFSASKSDLNRRGE